MAVELKDLTKRSENYSQWYNELVVKADLAEQSAVRGASTGIWHSISSCWNTKSRTAPRSVRTGRRRKQRSNA